MRARYLLFSKNSLIRKDLYKYTPKSSIFSILKLATLEEFLFIENAASILKIMSSTFLTSYIGL